MSTIATVTGDADVAATGAPEGSGASSDSPAGRGRSGSPQRGVGMQRRSLLVPVLTTLTGSLVVGVFALAALGFNTLRNDMKEGFARIDAQFVAVDAKFVAVDAKIDAEIGALDAKIDERFGALDAKIDAEIGALDAKIGALDAKFDARFAEVQMVLLDHTDRLARIEAIQSTHTHQ